MLKRFLNSQRTGFYFGVVEEGVVQTGDDLEQLSAHPAKLRVADIFRLYTTARSDEELSRKAVFVPALPEKWRGFFEEQLKRLQS